MAELLRLANAGETRREIGDWAETETALDIQRSLDLVYNSDRPAVTMVSGGTGIGKTLTVKRRCETLGRDGIYMQVARGEGTAWNFALSLASLWGHAAPTFNTLSEARMKLASCIGRGRLLVVDEAQYLNQKNRRNGQIGEAFEWLRAAAEDGEFHVVFCGDLTLTRVIGGFPQLQSRLLRPVTIPRASRADVAAVVEGTAFGNGRCIDALLAIAQMKGGLRNVENVTRIAALFAGTGQPTPEHLKAAIADMKLAPKGGA